MTAAERIAEQLRREILDGERPAGAPLREQHLCDTTGASRHTVRAALRLLAAEGLASVERNRGAFVRAAGAREIQALGELRIALEVEAARLALERHGRMPETVHEACAALTEACAGGSFAAVATAHEHLHSAIVGASGSSRIIAAHRPLATEGQLFLVRLRPFWELGGLAREHEQLIDDLEQHGSEALRVHISASTAALTTGLKF